MSLIPATPRRGSRRTRESNSETLENASPPGQELQVAATPRRGLRKTKATTPEFSEQADEGAAAVEETVKLPSTSKRTTRGAKSSVGDQESSQFVTDQKGKMTVSPRSTKKWKNIASRPVENVSCDQAWEHNEQQLPVPARRGRPRKNSTLEVISDKETETEEQLMPVPTRRGRPRKNSMSEVRSNQELQPRQQQQSVPARRGRPRKNVMLEVSEASGLDSSQLLHQTELTLPVNTRKNAKRGTYLPAATESVLIQGERSPHEGEKMLNTPRRSARVIPAKAERTHTGESILEKTVVQSTEALATARSLKKRLTGIQNRKSQLPLVTEESTEEEDLPHGTDSKEGLQTADINYLRLGVRDITLADHGIRITRTRSSKKSVQQNLSVEENESFFFSPPLTKLSKKLKGEKAMHPVQFKDLDADLSSQFVFSPPVLRSTRKHVSSISRIVKELELPIKEEEDTMSIKSLEKQKVRRGRPAKLKTKKKSKVAGKEGSWSPPPVEIKFISPLGSPVDGAKSKPKESAETSGKTLRKNKKRLSNFPKTVVRRKML
uniref:Uncharacterized protein n=1 Tax=Sphenodon punctatus TaxID=8508 RepID=A0A8D0H7C8_SPHPU